MADTLLSNTWPAPPERDRQSTMQNVRTTIKNRCPWLVPMVLYGRRRRYKLREFIDICQFGLTFGRGVTRSIRPNISFRTHPLAWRTSFFAFAPGGYVADEMAAFISECKPGMRLIDVGAAYGIFSLVTMAWPESQALLLEPFPKSQRMIAALKRINCLSDERFRLLPVAAGERDGQLPMEQRDGVLLVASTSGDSVEMRSLDSLCDQLNFSPTHLKVDVEGFELAVLKGAAKVLEQFKPVIHLEIHNRMLMDRGVSLDVLTALLKGFDYQVVWSSPEYASDNTVLITRTIWRVQPES